MGVNPKRKTYYNVDRRALVSDHAVGDALSGTVDISSFTEATHYPNGYLPALMPVTADANGMLTFCDTSVAGADLSGFTLNPVDVDGDEPVAYIWHGVIDDALLPVTFNKANITAAAAARFVFKKA